MSDFRFIELHGEDETLTWNIAHIARVAPNPDGTCTVYIVDPTGKKNEVNASEKYEDVLTVVNTFRQRKDGAEGGVDTLYA